MQKVMPLDSLLYLTCLIGNVQVSLRQEHEEGLQRDSQHCLGSTMLSGCLGMYFSA